MAEAFAAPLEPFLNQMIQQAALEAEGYALRQMDHMVAETIRGAARATSQQLVQLADAIERGVSPSDRLALHRSLGRNGQRSVLASFDATRGRSTTNAALNRSSGAKYRRYAGGRLRAALADSAFWQATEDGLLFINVELLNRRARQWARLNFGAGERGKGSRPSVGVYLGAMQIAALGLEEGPRPAYRMPTGYFTDNSGVPVAGRTPGAAFFLYKNGPYRRGTVGGGVSYQNSEGKVERLPLIQARMVGFEGRQFLDAGVSRIAREIGPGYQELYRRFFAQAETTVRPYSVTASVRTVR